MGYPKDAKRCQTVVTIVKVDVEGNQTQKSRKCLRKTLPGSVYCVLCAPEPDEVLLS